MEAIDDSSNSDGGDTEAKELESLDQDYVAEPELVEPNELTTSNSREHVKRKLDVLNIDIKPAGNFSLVGHTAQNLRQIDSVGTCFGMSDFALPNSRRKSKTR